MKRTLALVALMALGAPACDRSAPTPPPPAPAAPPAASSAPPTTSAEAEAPTTLDAAGGITAAAPTAVSFETEAVGGPASAFEAVVGEWRIEQAGGEKGLAVDGTKWRDGTASATLADQAKKLYGDRYAEFLDGVKTFAFYPLAVARDEPIAGDAEVSVRFLPLAGKIDQAAGIAFGIAPDGSYWGVRANALEDNVLFFRIVRGKRTILETVRGVPTPSKTWHTLKVTLAGRKVEAFVDGVKRLDRTLDAPPVGRVGLWSKADSHVVFDDFTIARR